MSILQLFSNLKNHTILRGNPSFSEDSDLDFLASLDFGIPEKRKCSKGYPCGKSCIQTTKNCKNPIEGQAKVYSEWLELENKKDELDTVEPTKIVEPEPEIIVNLADFESVKNLGERLAEKYLQNKDGVDYLEKIKNINKELSSIETYLDLIAKSVDKTENEATRALYLAQMADLSDRHGELIYELSAAQSGLSLGDFKELDNKRQSFEKAKLDLDFFKSGNFIREKDPAAKLKELQDNFIKEQKEYESLKTEKTRKQFSGLKMMADDLITAGGKSEADANVWLNSLGKRTAKVKKSDQALKDVYRLTGGNIPTLKRLGYTTKRAYANEGDGFINVGASERPAIIFHEVGHHLEYSNPALKESANAFLEKRSSGKIQTLRKITGSKVYKADEVAVIDNFVDPYVGKKYKNGSTEVISMGLERFSTPEEMQKFRDKDPEHFHYILGVLAHVNNLKP